MNKAYRDGNIIQQVVYKDTEDLKYTATKAYQLSPYWRKKFEEAQINPQNITPENLKEKLYEISIEPRDLYRSDVATKTNDFKLILQTSGTTGKPKEIHFLPKHESKRVARQIEKWLIDYLNEKNKIVSFFPPLPSASGIMFYEASKIVASSENKNLEFYQIPTQLLQPEQKEILLNRLTTINPTIIGALPTVIYMLANSLPENIRKDVRLLITGAEELPINLAKKILQAFPNAEFVDVYGTSEDGATGYRKISKNYLTPFSFPETLVTLLQDETSNYYKIYLTKITRRPNFFEKLTKKESIVGLYLFNYNIGDYAEVNEGNVVRIFRENDAISLAGAKLFLTQISEIIHSYENLVDYVVIFYPLGIVDKPKAVLKVGYVGNKPNLESEIRNRIYESNNPVRYEVEDSKMAELEILLVPISELRKDLPQKPGKPKRLYRAGNDL